MKQSTSIIIGNGASQKYYQPQDAFVVVCNTNTHIPHDVCSVIDHQPIDYWAEYWIDTHQPLWVSPKAERAIKRYNLKCEYECVHNSTIKYNNAQCVALQLLKRGATTIHLYGCDTLWQEDMTSTQDTLIPRPHRDTTLWIVWRKLWQQIFEKNTQVDYYIHQPVNATCINYGANVFYHQHLDLQEQSNK
jgi:hypothetical protein